MWEDLTNREIARAIGTTEQVVKNYLRNTFDKLGVWSRLELAIYVAGHCGARWQNELVPRSGSNENSENRDNDDLSKDVTRSA